jgi:hypothetical protein
LTGLAGCIKLSHGENNRWLIRREYIFFLKIFAQPHRTRIEFQHYLFFIEIGCGRHSWQLHLDRSPGLIAMTDIRASFGEAEQYEKSPQRLLSDFS